MPAASATMKKITLETLQGDLFEVDEVFVNECRKIKHLIDGKFTRNVKLSLKIKSETMSKVIEYVNKHVEYGATMNKADEENLKAWDAEFMKVDMDPLYDLIMAASNLGHKSLLDLVRQTVAEKIRGKNQYQIREIFNIKNDLTPEQEIEEKRMFNSIFYREEEEEHQMMSNSMFSP